MNRTVYLLAVFFFLLCALLIKMKVTYGGESLDSLSSQSLWRINLVMHATGSGKRVKIRATLPRDSDRQTIYNEHVESANMNFYTREREKTKNRIGFWREDVFDMDKLVQYSFSVELRSRSYPMPGGEHLSKNPFRTYPEAVHLWLNASKDIQSDNRDLRLQLRKIIGRERSVSRVVREIFDFVRGQVQYRSEKGSKDSQQTLAQLVADCGGQARLFAAFCRAAGIPSRLVGGVIVEKKIKKITHVWVENYIGGQWIPFDVVNNHYASIPDNYLELYRGDYSLIKHTGLDKFEYFFVISKARIPPVANPWSLYILPLNIQYMINILLLIPVGALVVTFFRNVVGLDVFGTFTPILLSLAFREISLPVGLVSMAILIGVGWALYKVLDFLKILLIPKLAIIITTVVIMILILMLVGFHHGERSVLYIALFPIVIITWMIERFTIAQVEDGPFVAFKTAVGTAIVAACAYYIMQISVVQIYLFAFPEILFALIGVLLILGRYSGMRLLEVFRFRELFKRKAV